MTSRVNTTFWPIIAGILFAFCLMLVVSKNSPKPSTKETNLSFASAVNASKQSVASIHTQQVVARSNLRARLQNGGAVTSGLGSAVIIDESGYLLTNHHVIAGADQIVVTLYDGRQTRAKVVGTDEASDLAVLWIDLDNLKPIVFGNLNNIEVGDVVLAIGNPFGFGHTVTQGIISATGRWGLNRSPYEDYIQTDADINVGNSGGALINTKGELLGISSAIYSLSGKSQGIGLAIPSDTAQRIMQELIQQGTVVRGWMGVGIQEINERIAQHLQLTVKHGLIVTGTYNGGPADIAGIRAGDIITAIDKQPLASGRSGMLQVSMLLPGTTIMVEILRGEARTELPVVVGQKPTS